MKPDHGTTRCLVCKGKGVISKGPLEPVGPNVLFEANGGQWFADIRPVQKLNTEFAYSIEPTLGFACRFRANCLFRALKWDSDIPVWGLQQFGGSPFKWLARIFELSKQRYCNLLTIELLWATIPGPWVIAICPLPSTDFDGVFPTFVQVDVHLELKKVWYKQFICSTYACTFTYTSTDVTIITQMYAQICYTRHQWYFIIFDQFLSTLILSLDDGGLSLFEAIMVSFNSGLGATTSVVAYAASLSGYLGCSTCLVHIYIYAGFSCLEPTLRSDNTTHKYLYNIQNIHVYIYIC